MWLRELSSSCGEQGRLWFRCMGFSLRWLHLLQDTGSRACRLQYLQRVGSAVAAQGSRAQAHWLWSTVIVARGIFQDQGSNPCLLHWQVDSFPLSLQFMKGRPFHKHLQNNRASNNLHLIFSQYFPSSPKEEKSNSKRDVPPQLANLTTYFLKENT